MIDDYEKRCTCTCVVCMEREETHVMEDRRERKREVSNRSCMIMRRI